MSNVQIFHVLAHAALEGKCVLKSRWQATQ